MAERYPNLVYSENVEDERVCWNGTITIEELGSGVQTTLSARIDLPADYPNSEPVAYETGGRFWTKDLEGHVTAAGAGLARCCLWLPPRSEWNGKRTDALLRFMDHVVVFFERHLTFLAAMETTERKEWPGPQSAHGNHGYVEWFREKLHVDESCLRRFVSLLDSGADPYRSCPCGSDKAFKYCHRDAIRELKQNAGPALAHALSELRTQTK